jgi:ABC-2 type transport system permease protein
MTGLRQTLAIARREAGAFFAAPIAPIVAVLFLVVEGFSFFAVVRVLADPRRPAPYGAVLRTHFGGTFLYWAFMFFVVAALTMRLVAEERRSGTWELLRTAPVSSAAIVTGKWLGALAAYLGLWSLTLAHVAILVWLAPVEARPDWGPVVTAYLGVAVTGGSALAIGVLGSSLARSQMVAAALTFVGLLLLLLVGLLPELAPETLARAPWLARVAGAVDVRRHMDDFARGIVDTRHLWIHAALAAVALVAAAVAITVERRPRERPAGALGVALTAAVAILSGVEVARHPLRLDATSAGVYTLEPGTRELLAEVRAPVTLLVLTAGRPEFADLYDEVLELVRRFQVAAPPGMVRVDSLDPALDPGRIEALAGDLALSPEELAGGGAVVVTSGGRTRAVALLDMAAFTDAGDGGRLAWFRGEEALAAALLEVTDPDRPAVCFATAHGELPLDAEEGDVDITRLVATLGRDGFASQPLSSFLSTVPASCAVLAIVGPRARCRPTRRRWSRRTWRAAGGCCWRRGRGPSASRRRCTRAASSSTRRSWWIPRPRSARPGSGRRSTDTATTRSPPAFAAGGSPSGISRAGSRRARRAGVGLAAGAVLAGKLGRERAVTGACCALARRRARATRAGRCPSPSPPRTTPAARGWWSSAPRGRSPPASSSATAPPTTPCSVAPSPGSPGAASDSVSVPRRRSSCASR